MSLAGSGAEENSSLNIPNILADFFLKKINMPTYSDDCDYKHREKKKKSKHKKRKHKKSKHRHTSSSSSSTYSTSNDKGIMDDVSSSEEISMKRLKKIKDKLSSSNKSGSQNLCSVNQPVESVEDNKPNISSSANLVCYGPSLELLLSGVDAIYSKPNSESISIEINSTGKESVDLVSASRSEKSEEDNKMDFFETGNNLKTSPLSSDLQTCPNHDLQHELLNNQKIISDMSDKDESSSKDCNSVNLCCDTNQPDIQKEKNNQENNRKVSEDKTTNYMNIIIPNKTNLKNESKGKSHSRSRSRSRSNSKSDKKSSKHKHKKRSRSRSSSRESHKAARDKRRRYSRSRSCDKSKSHKRRSISKSHSRSRSRSRYSQYRRHSRSRTPQRKTEYRRSKSRSRSQSRRRKYSDSSRNREYSPISRNKSKSYKHSSRSRSRSRSKSRTSIMKKETTHSHSKTRSRSKSKEKKSATPKSSKIDQAKVLETAKMNIRNMIKNGTLPEGLNAEILKKEQLISIQAGGKSVQELTEYCQRLSQKENDPDESEDEKDKPDDETGFIHHPFKVKEPTTIKLNIKNAVQLPIKTHAQKVAETARLSSQFPVSSGNQHRQKELEWVPVVPDKPSLQQTNKPEPANKNISSPTTNNAVAVIDTPVSSSTSAPVSYPCLPSSEIPQSAATATGSPLLQSSVVTPPPPVPPPPPPVLPLSPAPPTQVNQQCTPLLPTSNQNFMCSYPTPIQQQTMVPPALPSTVIPIPSSSKVFKPPKKLDISSIVAKRFQALTKLQHSPNDPEALRTIQEAQESIQEWVQSQQVPGLFTGSTDARVLTAAELCGPKYYKFRKDILTHAPPVTEGKGMSLLKKMGWNPGEGLGKNKEGNVEPLVLDIKMDKKGLVSEGENSRRVNNSFMKELQGKHPVSALMELCSKRRWKPPLYTCVLDHGPPHKKLFCFKVEVNGVEYQPLNPCSNKKVAKADSAIICLQALNVFPKES